MKRLLHPTLVVAVFLTGYVWLSLARHNGDIYETARLGIRWAEGDHTGLEGYDGQYAYFIAADPGIVFDNVRAYKYIDVPAYRYQRILYPLLARVAALGQVPLIPWSLLAVNFGAHIIGTWLVGELLVRYGVSQWYALTYGLFVGLVYAIRLDLTEPLAYAFVAGALWASQRGREGLAAVLYGLAVFTKETTLLFVAAHLVWLATRYRWRNVLWLVVATVVPFSLFQYFIFSLFGRFGLGSGGFLATGFEFIPFNGLWRIGNESLPALLLFVGVFGPMVVLPSLWGIWLALDRIRMRDISLPILALGANAGFIPFTPYSTFREPLGLIRLIVGLVLATLVVGAHLKSKRVLNYSLLWLAALAFLLNDL